MAAGRSLHQKANHSMSTEIVVISDVEELEREYRADWERLHAATPHANFFQSLDWFGVRSRHQLEGDSGFRTYVVRDGAEVTGIVPTVIKESDSKLGLTRKLKFPDECWCSFYGPVSADPEKTLSAVSDFIWKNNEDNLDVIDFALLPGYRDGQQPDVVRRTMGGQNAHEFSQVATLHLEDDWEAYWESRRKVQKNRRRNVERCERRLAELGEITWKRHRTGNGESAPEWEMFDQCVELAGMSWQDGLIDGNTLHHESVHGFIRDVHEAASKAGGLDMSVLYLDGKPQAFVYGYHYLGYVDLMRVGYNPELAKLAPGNALWTRLIADSFERGDRILDFGPSCLDYKKFWISEIEDSFIVTQYASTPKGQSLRLAQKVRGKKDVLFTEKDTNERSKRLAAENKKSDTPNQTLSR